MDMEERLQLILSLVDQISDKRDELIEIAVRDIGFTYKDTSHEVDLVIRCLKNFKNDIKFLENGKPICERGKEVAIISPYNGSAWLNVSIASVFLAGNNVRVRFSSKDFAIAIFFEKIYREIFDDAIKFDYRSGDEFMSYAINSPKVKAIVAFGSDRTFLRYEDAVRNVKRKFIFEGPGNDPFIVLSDANLELAVNDLVSSKYMYSGQACIAPERIYVQEEIYDDFLREFVDLTKSLIVGDPKNPETDVGPVVSKKAIENIKKQLIDAERKGARIVYGGKIEGNYPTIVADANHSMLGMREEVFGPVCYVCKFKTPEEIINLARDSKYGLRATIYEKREGKIIAEALKGADYLEEVEDYTFGKFGTVSLNEPLSESWRDALVTKPVGGYGYSGWVWDFVGKFRIRQGPKLFSIETSIADLGDVTCTR